MINKISNKLRLNNIDAWLVLIGVLYVSLPVMIFALGWLRLLYGIPVSILILLFIYRAWKELSAAESSGNRLISSQTITFWTITFLAVLFWVYLSGIGGLVWQNGDHIGRNPTFRDLSTQNWPLIIDLSKENDTVQQVCGSGKVGYTYYFCWWLPVALIAKVFALGDGSRSFLLFLYAVLGVFLIVYMICRKLGRCSYWAVICMILFSGADAIPNCLINGIDPTRHIEWWSRLFQYSSNTTQLFWVFNQAIPIWLIVILILQSEKNRYIIALGALAFAYSPWATISLIPMVIAMGLKKNNIKELLNVPNILTPIILLVVFGSFYTSGNASSGGVTDSFTYYDIDPRRVLLIYLVFMLFEVGLYFIVMGRYAMEYEMYYVVYAELFIIPLVIVRDYNFIMRASIPALFALMLYVIRFLTDRVNDSRDYRIRYVILLAVFILGSITPMHEINRVIKNTITEDNLLQEDCYSYADIQMEDEGYISLIKDQFFVYDYENKFFYKYLAGRDN